MTLSVENISRRFGERLALDNVSFQVKPGRLTGFVGGNGAGKTTTMRIILGVLAADTGTVSFNGSPLSAATRRKFGYMPEERGLYPKMPLREQLVYFASLHGFSTVEAKKQSDDLIDLLELGDRQNDPIENLSLGNQQRAQVAVSLVHNPSALVLDEPFSGLDPLAVDVIVSVLSEKAAQGIPVLLSSHQLDVVERLCDDLVVISGGKILASGSIDELRDAAGNDRVRIDAGSDLAWLRNVTGVKVLELAGTSALIEMTEPNQRDLILRTAIDRGPVYNFASEPLRLQEIFRETVAEGGVHSSHHHRFVGEKA